MLYVHNMLDILIISSTFSEIILILYQRHSDKDFPCLVNLYNVKSNGYFHS